MSNGTRSKFTVTKRSAVAATPPAPSKNGVGDADFWKTEVHTKHPMSCLQEMCIKMRIPQPKLNCEYSHFNETFELDMTCEDRCLKLTIAKARAMKLQGNAVNPSATHSKRKNKPSNIVRYIAADIMMAGFYDEHKMHHESALFDDECVKSIDPDYQTKLTRHQMTLDGRFEQSKQDILSDLTITEESKKRRVRLLTEINDECFKPAYDNLQSAYQNTSQKMVIFTQCLSRNRFLHRITVSKILPDGSLCDASEKTPKPEVRAEELETHQPFTATCQIFKFADTNRLTPVFERTVKDMSSGDRKAIKNKLAEVMVTDMIAEGLIREALPAIMKPTKPPNAVYRPERNFQQEGYNKRVTPWTPGIDYGKRATGQMSQVYNQQPVSYDAHFKKFTADNYKPPPAFINSGPNWNQMNQMFMQTQQRMAGMGSVMQTQFQMMQRNMNMQVSQVQSFVQNRNNMRANRSGGFSGSMGGTMGGSISDMKKKPDFSADKTGVEEFQINPLTKPGGNW